MILEVGGVVHPAEDTNRAGCGTRRVAATLEAFPAQLEKYSLLWVHYLGFSRRYAEKAGVEHFDVFDDASRTHVVGVVAQIRRDGRVDLVGLKECDGLPTGAEVFPKCFDAVCPGKSSGKRNDCNRLVCLGRILATAVRNPSAWDRVVIGFIQLGGDSGRRWIAEKVGCWNVSPCFAVQARQNAQYQKGTAAKFKEVVQTSDPIKAKQLCKYRAQKFLGRRRGSEVGSGKLRSGIVRGRERAPVQFAIGRYRECRQRDKSVRHHEIRQRFPKMVAQICRMNGLVHWNYIADQSRPPWLVIACDDRTTANTRMLGQCGFYFPEFNAKAAYLYLAIAATNELDVSIGQVAYKVTGTIEAVTRHTKRISDEAFSRQIGTTQITAREPGSPYT